MAALIRKLLVVAAVAALVSPAWSGGDDYDAASDTEDKGPAYFGFVRDHRGSPVAEARVVLKSKSREPVVLKTNVLGLYRSHIHKDVRPEEVEVSCDKTGYKQTQAYRRTPPGAAMIETDCTLQRL